MAQANQEDKKKKEAPKKRKVPFKVGGLIARNRRQQNTQAANLGMRIPFPNIPDPFGEEASMKKEKNN